MSHRDSVKITCSLFEVNKMKKSIKKKFVKIYPEEKLEITEL